MMLKIETVSLNKFSYIQLHNDKESHTRTWHLADTQKIGDILNVSISI